MDNSSANKNFTNIMVITDFINTIALNKCTDTKHSIYFQNGNEVQSFTLAELDYRATNVACHLSSIGIHPHDRVGIMARNCIEWVLLDLAILKLGAVTAGFESGRFNPEQIMNNYALKALFVDGMHRNKAFFDLDMIRHWGEDTTLTPATSFFHSGYDPADICAIKFTSGSTGIPKGLEATVASVNGSLSSVQHMFMHGDDDNILIFLRLALLQQRYWIYSSLVNKHNITLANMDNVLMMAQATSPTIIMGVPAFYESLKTKIEAEYFPTQDFSMYQKTIQTLLGGRIRYLWTGSAPASPALLKFFNNNGVPLYEGYGLNETCIIAKNCPSAFRLGSVGKVLPNKTVRFDKDGILIIGSRYPVNCQYSWCAPGANEKVFLPTAEVKTYDLGHIDEDGFLYIHGRIDDIITLSNGRNVLVRTIEEKLHEHSDVHECVLFGNGKPFITALVSPASMDAVHTSLENYIKNLNKTLLEEQKIHALVLTSEKFSVDNGLLTSQFKPKRQEIYHRYMQELNSIYELHVNSCSSNFDATLVVVIADKIKSLSNDLIGK